MLRVTMLECCSIYLFMNIIVENLTFAFNAKEYVLKDLNLHSQANSIAIVGASGGGKSTLLRIMSGLIRQNKDNDLHGKVSINGLSPEQLIDTKSIGFIFQEDSLIPYLSVQQNVELPLKLKGETNMESAEYFLSKVGLFNDRSKLPRELSGGMRTRVELARTFVTRPKVLFLDEPFVGLDEYWRTSLYKELELLREETSPITILVTHHIEEALMLANHIFVLGKHKHIIKDFVIEVPLPRVFDENPMAGLEDLKQGISKLIISDSLTNEKER